MDQQANTSWQPLGAVGGQDVSSGPARPDRPGLPGGDRQGQEPVAQKPGATGPDLSLTWDEEGSMTARVHLSRAARQRLVRAWRQAHAREARSNESDESDRLIA
jgi:hypothetical protein